MAQIEYLLRYAEPAAPSTWYLVASTHGRTTSATDTPAHTYVHGGLTLPNYEIYLFSGIDPEFSPNAGTGQIIIADGKSDGSAQQLDWLLGKVFDGGVLELRRGTVGADYSTFTLVASFISAGLMYDGKQKIVRTRDLGQLLTANLHDEVYGGTGGADGDASLAGVVKPYAIGDLTDMNIPLQLVTAASLIYQASCTPVNSVVSVRDGGVALTLDASVGTSGDFASYTALAAGTAPGVGKYATCLAEGFIRLGSSPTYDVTAGITGDKTGGTYFQKRGDIAKQIVTRAGTALTSGQVDSTALSALNTAQAATCGFFWNAAITKAEALTEVMSGVLGYWFVSPAGLLVLGALDTYSLTADATYDFVVDGGGTLPSNTEGAIPPRWKTTIGYQRNYFVQPKSRLAGLVVTDANALIYGQESQWTTYTFTSGSLRTNWPTSRVVQVQGNFASKSDADDEAERQAGLFSTGNSTKSGPERWSVPIKADPFEVAALLGKTVAISGYTRSGWPSPRNFRLVGFQMSPNTQFVTLTLWGKN